ncbi:hypothetical protein MRX96_000200 [Rhipicephalus microplus]
MLRRVHEGHQGIARCRASAKESLWWPGISKDIAQTVATCQACATERTKFPEPSITSETTELPWQKIGFDLRRKELSILPLLIITPAILSWPCWVEERRRRRSSST